jgi:hypothetical protein
LDCIEGEGDTITQNLLLDDFVKIHLTTAANVTISQGAIQEVKVTGNSNIIAKLKTSISNDIWTIDFEEGCYRNSGLDIEITVPNIESVRLSGSGNVTINNFSNQSALENILSGSGDVTINAFEGITILNATLNGSGSIQANNNITTLVVLNLDISGSSEYRGFAISSIDVIVESSGSGNCEITAFSDLNVKISGSGNVSYKGTPTITQDISGSGDLIDAN